MATSAASILLMAVLLTVQAPGAHSSSGGIAKALDAFKYFYPLVLVNLTRTSQLQGYVKAGAVEGGINQLSPARSVPTSDFKEIVKANVDTLYITAWLDLTEDAMVLSVPAIADRFYMVQLMDAWSNSFASPGTRTTGTAARDFVICGPRYENTRTAEVCKRPSSIKSPTNVVWLLARIQILEGEDISKVHSLQDQFSISPFREWIRNRDTAKRPLVPDHQTSASEGPPEIVDSWSAREYFSYAAELLKTSSPPAADADMLQTLAELGFQQGQSLQWYKLTSSQRKSLKLGKKYGKRATLAAAARIQTEENGWRGLPNTIGDYGTDYDTRAAVAVVGLGANKAEDAVYRVHNFEGGRSAIRFEAGELPPVKAFWSLTAYTKEGYLVPNSISRYSRGSESGLYKAADGSVTIHLQGEEPATEEERRNWLPTPDDDSSFVITARLYYPEQAILDSTYSLPAVTAARRLAHDEHSMQTNLVILV